MHNLIKKGISAFLTFSVFISFSAAPALAAVSYQYDTNGNMTSDGTNCYHYNEANQMDKVTNCGNGQTTAEYVYDYSGTRLVKKVYTNGVLTNTVYSPADEYETVKQATNGATANTNYYKANDEVVAKKNPDGTITYYTNDHLGSTAVLSDQTGAVVEKTAYKPYGEVKSGGTKSKFGYTGQEQDPESGLDYYNARYYNPHMQRFTQPDTYTQNVYDPQDLNEYSYVKNNPLRYTDPSGHFFWIPLMIMGAGAVIGGLDAYSTYISENPNATWQQKAAAIAGGAALGGAAAGVGMFGGEGLLATGVLSAVSSGAQRGYLNWLEGKDIRTDVVSDAYKGGIMGIGVAKVSKVLKLLPKNVGRPVDPLLNRSFVSSLSKNSQNYYARQLGTDVIGTSLGSSIDSVKTISSNTNTSQKNSNPYGTGVYSGSINKSSLIANPAQCYCSRPYLY